MKYVSYTFVDDATQIPVSVEPARKGPIMPEGVTYIFSNEQSFSSGVPKFYGTIKEPLPWMSVYSKEVFLELFKRELKERNTLKRKNFLSSSVIEILSYQFDYSKETLDGLNSILNTMSLDRTIKQVDFLTKCSWAELDLKQVKIILKTLNKNVQKLYSWCCKADKEIDTCKTIEDCLSIQSKLNNFNVE